LNLDLGVTYTTLSTLADANHNNCNSPNANPAFCQVRAQLLSEVQNAANIHQFYNNLKSLWATSGTITILSQLSAFNDVKATLPQAPGAAPASSLVAPLVNLFLGLAGNAPVVGPVFGLADLFFNFATGLATDYQGNPTIDLTSTIGKLQTQASDQFTAQGNATATMFQLILQDGGKLQTLGSALAKSDINSPWYWSANASAQILQTMTPAIRQAAYQSIMPAAYGIGSYLPQTPINCYGNGPNTVWGQFPLWQQPRSYVVLDTDFNCGNLGNTPTVQPFAPNNNDSIYRPYTYPTDSANPYVNDTSTGTILGNSSWLGISSLTSRTNSGPGTHYDPPDPSLLSTLFKPLSQSGLGVYRPAFFEGWAFPRVTCALSYGGYPPGQGMSIGGCDWGSAKLSSPPEPPSSLVTSLNMQATQIASSGNEIDVRLTIYNNGTVTANSVNLASIKLRTLSGSEQATLLNAAMPMQVSTLAPGDSTDVILKLDVPATATKIELLETGSVDVGQPQPVQFSEGQVFYPQR
jgi:hypothetical protein